jgi:hypothetical protein
MSGSEHGGHDGRADHDDSGHGSSGHDGKRHGKGHGGGHGRGSGSGNGPSDEELTGFASGRGGPGLAPTSTSVIVALALSVAMGALGGWVLRVSAGS